MADGEERYSCQIRLFGRAGQSRLQKASVAIVGVGGLGTVAASYLVRAGIGRLDLVDRDVVEKSNLNRQLLFDETDVNRPKATAAAEKLGRMNPSVSIKPVVDEFPCKVDVPDVIVDCSDNMECRLAVNHFAVRTGIPLVYGAASGWTGAISTIIPGVTACLNCLTINFTERMKTDGCDSSNGVSGPLLGVIGSMQASEALKCILGDTKSLVLGKILYFDSRKNVFDEAKMKRMANCPACGGMKRRQKKK